MGKKLVAVFVTIACACALCLALVGCGGGDPKANFTGAWELETIEDADLGTVDTAILKQMNMPVNMTLNEDGSADFVHVRPEHRRDLDGQQRNADDAHARGRG